MSSAQLSITPTHITGMLRARLGNTKVAPHVVSSWRRCVEEFGIDVKLPVKHIPSRLCVHSAFTSTGKDRFTARHLDFLTDYAEQNGLKGAGCAFGNLACSVVDDGEITGFFEVWLPIEET